jgi:hypothetical protein
MNPLWGRESAAFDVLVGREYFGTAEHRPVGFETHDRTVRRRAGDATQPTAPATSPGR